MILDVLCVAVFVVLFGAVAWGLFLDGGCAAVLFVFGGAAVLLAAALHLDGAW